MKKKIQILFFALSLWLPFAARAQFTWSYNNLNDTATITGYTGSGGAVTIPSTVTYSATVYSVTAIGTNAFLYNTTITGITIPASVTSIDDGAFEVSDGLTSVTIPNSVTNIGENAFNGCAGLTNITVAADNPAYSSVNGVLFNKNQTTLIQYPAGSVGSSYAIPATVTNLGLNSFEGSDGLKNMTIPGNLQNIGIGAFSNCLGLTNAVIGDGVTNLADYAFYDCPVLTNLIFLGNAPPLGGSHVFTYHPAAATVYYLPGASGWSSTYGGLPTVALTAVGDFTFTINNKSATVTGYTGTNGNVTIPDVIFGYPVTAIGDSVFENDSTMTSITIPDSVTSIGDEAFLYCSGLTNITIPDSVTNIGTETFYGCYGLKNVVIGNGVTSIGDYVFEDCNNLTSVIIGNSVTSIGDYAFAGCSSLTGLYFMGNAPTPGNNVFYDADTAATVYHLVGASGWGSTYDGLPVQLTSNGFGLTVNNGDVTITSYIGSGGNLAIPDVLLGYPVTAIGANAFANNDTLTSVTIPDSVTNIGASAFYECFGLTNINIGNGMTSLGSGAFLYCTSLTSVTIPASVTSLGDEAFAGCLGLTSVVFLGNAPALGGSYVFVTSISPLTYEPATAYYLPGTSGWSSTYDGLPTAPLTVNGFNFTINNGAAIITGYTGSSDNVTIPNVIYGYPVTAIGGNAFANNGNLTSITIPDSVTNIGVEAFYNCAALTSVTLPDGIISLGAETFYNCASLTSITIPASVTSLGAGAFESCISLTGATFLGNAPALGNVAFGGDFATVYYYAGTTGWGATYGGLPTVELAAPTPPQIAFGSAGIHSGAFNFTVTGASNQTVIVEASTNLISWQPVWTNTLSGTNAAFTDSQWTNYPARFYRVR